MKLHLRKNLQILALAFSISIGAHAATQADIASWTRGAKAGNVTDQYNLGLAYGKGEGVAANFTESFKWFKIAAENGHSDSMYFVGGFYLSGTGIERNPLESEKWMLKAAKRGNKDAQQALVLFYRDGAGEPAVPRNAAKAKYWQDVIDGKASLVTPREAASKPQENRFGGEPVTDANPPRGQNSGAPKYEGSSSETSRNKGSNTGAASGQHIQTTVGKAHKERVDALADEIKNEWHRGDSSFTWQNAHDKAEELVSNEERMKLGDRNRDQRTRDKN